VEEKLRRKPKILVVDDNVFNIRVVIGLLDALGYEADTAKSGKMAIALVKRNDYNIVFMDHLMPEMDGVQTVREIRQWGGQYMNMNIIALTGDASGRAFFIENGFTDFIAKPVDVNALRNILQNFGRQPS
jgi:CheY-like chemotaxis protein